MIKITIYKHDDVVTRVRCEGHSGLYPLGKDILCSAVSVLMINAVNSIEALTDGTFTLKSDEGIGLIDVIIDKSSDEVTLLLKSLVLGLEAISAEYGKKHLNIEYKHG